MDNNEIIKTEIMEEVKDTGKYGMKTAAVIGVSAVAGALLWNRVIKPVGRSIKTQLANVKAKHDKAKDDGASDEDSDE